MKKIKPLFLVIAVVLAFSVFALASGSNETDNQGKDNAAKEEKTETEEKTNLGEYDVVIDSCRLAKDYEGKDVVIVKYVFTNNSDDSTAFYTAFNDNVFQNGVGLNESYILDDSANYSADNQTKEIKKGASIDVEVAYELNDTTTDIEVEVKELISFNDDVVTKTFSIK